jgi:anti-sigma factor RsiW
MTTHEGRTGGMGIMDCEEVLVLLPEHLGGALSPTDARAVELHLGGCEACAEERSFAGSLRRAMPHPPADLAARIVARALMDPEGIRRDGALVGSISAAPRRRLSWRVIAPVSAAAMILLALGIGWNLGVQSDENGSLAWADAFDIPTESWGVEDWYVAGAPYLDGISDETLSLLMQEVER